MKEYVVEIYTMRSNNANNYSFDTYQEAKEYYDEMYNLHTGDIKISLFKVERLEFQDFWYDED